MNILLTNFLRNTKAVAAMEFALLVPIFLTIMMSVLEVSNFVYAQQKNEFSVSNMLWVLNKQNQLSSLQLQQVTTMVEQIHAPIAMPEKAYRVIITSMQRDKPGIGAHDKPYIYWQESYGNQTLGKPMFNYVGADKKNENELSEGDNRALRGFSFPMEGDQIIHVDVYTQYSAIIVNSFVPDTLNKTLHSFDFSRPRKGAFQFRPDELQQ
jgi:hypothetical protein